MTAILGQKKRRTDNRLLLLYKSLKSKARIPTDDLLPKTRRGRNQHSFAFQIPSASKLKMSISIASTPDHQGLE